MDEYKKALRDGFEAAKKAERARKEIKQVLENFKEEVLTASGGTLLIEIRQWKKPQSIADSMARAQSVFTRFEAPPTYEALTAYNPKAEKSEAKELAQWEQSENGYPCSLIIKSEKRNFQDRTALEAGLAQLLRNPQVGEILYRLKGSA